MSNSTSAITLLSVFNQGMARPPCRGRSGTAVCRWPVTVLFLLSNSVLSTLQCSSSASHSRSQAQISIINVPREGHVSSNTLSNEVLSDMEPGAQSMDPLYLRSSRDSATAGGQQFVHLCGDRLKSELMKICDKRFHDPSKSIGQLRLRKRSVILRRLPRTVVDECCQRSCNPTRLLKYCKNDNTGRHLGGMSSRNAGTNLTSIEITQEQHLHNRSLAQLHEPVRGNSSNAVTAPLPRKLIPLGSLINDYRIQSDPNIEY